MTTENTSIVYKIHLIAMQDRKLVRLLTCKVAEWFANKIGEEILLEAAAAGRKIAAGELTTNYSTLRNVIDYWQTKEGSVERVAQWAAKSCLDQCDFWSVGNMVRASIRDTDLTEEMVLEMLQEVTDELH